MHTVTFNLRDTCSTRCVEYILPGFMCLKVHFNLCKLDEVTAYGDNFQSGRPPRRGTLDASVPP